MVSSFLQNRKKAYQDQRVSETKKMVNKIQQAKSTNMLDREYLEIMVKEDEMFEQQKRADVARRARLLQSEAKRTCTYNNQVVSLLEV